MLGGRRGLKVHTGLDRAFSYLEDDVEVAAQRRRED